ncbi:MAG TPA: bifunctional [glutamine synthetase] adenylyltransferase/[glutamine synthetase]-adenylyl-L-tyrosine phosphorylase [Dongiaceae bacterium]|nr:bifunctional [glutamine synthetase] adenylyltransferase/[glutamine synthetase]-adenylyl-L-tyrosine phosphorylase [Dongiaceae bacterium]
MQSVLRIPDPEKLPLPGDGERARLGFEKIAGGPAVLQELADSGQGRALLNAVFGNSPFLSQLMESEPGIVEAFLAQDPSAVLADLVAGLAVHGADGDPARVMRALRQARRRVALLVALADICGQWSLEQVTEALASFADACLAVAADHLLRRAAEAGDLLLPSLERPSEDSGLVILGMGKLGARELNYSSDIDLIVLYDRDKVDYRGRRTLQDCFVRIARDLVRLLQDHTEDGYVFRTDLRLRPDPGSTPLAMSVLAAETYYEGMGQNWERAAMIKARAVAGDPQSGRKFLKHLRPFVWRKHLDFAAIQDIHSIKRQIHAVKGHREIAVGGHNIKLGRGGIREIEFFAQTQQLIWGGRLPELREPATCPAIRALVAAGRVAPEVGDAMIAAYRYLRHVEHRLQMVEDRQTQTLPPAGPELEAFARFCGHRDAAELTEVLLGHLAVVEDHYAELFEEAPTLSGPGSLVFTGTENDPDTVKTLGELGFRDGASISAAIRGWHAGRARAMRSTRARELLTELMPALLQALGRTSQPDEAFGRFDAFLHALPAGVQIFSLLYSNPGLLDLIAEIMGGAPRLAEHLSRNPALLDAVLTGGFFGEPPSPAELAQELDQQLALAGDLQDTLDLARRWARDRQFQIGVHILRGTSDADRAGGPLSDIADTVIAGLQPRVVAAFAAQHGKLPGRGMLTLALGKLGGREMSIGSDLDLIFIYDAPATLEGTGWDTLLSDGPKPLAPIHYYARLAQRMIAAITAPTGEGRLYEVDMRLRPSGNSGPIASSLEGFRRYQHADAWTWEHMALTRARVISGDPGLAGEAQAVLREVLTRRRDPVKLAADVAGMRRRIAQQHPTDRLFDLKHLAGGIIDIEFIAQYLMLRHAAERPQVLSTGTAAALGALAAAGCLARDRYEQLSRALGLWRRLQGFLRITLGSRFDEASLAPSVARRLAELGGVVDFPALKNQISATAATVRRIYLEIVEAQEGSS